ncbi:dNTP triphosphohydrolase [Burkholderia stagnalis]|uniref:dGTP triphosphohydrolase n=1 Tax=Burkholderia stagnalis TaxID=1503054 RepID=UPI000F59576E|nr:dNTP triphosphohydrolase [Burkholderia stagnalis]RQQ15536.1 dNTP triphosphohydrolase [Burkholderia stagnalis]
MRKKLYSNGDYMRLSGADGMDAKREHGWSPFKKDYARLLHAPAFRRLQGKTQLFPGTESDFFRNRLTHSLEVAQIACGIATAVNAKFESELGGEKIDTDLVQFAAIAHDLGHPPFGHNGEKALDALMLKSGGFEGNAQTLRILTSVERKLVRAPEGFSSDFGLDLTHRALASVLKYDHLIEAQRPKNDELKKGYYYTEADIIRRVKEAVAPGYNGRDFKTVECSIMDLADDIAYSTYDLEDSLHANFVSPFSLQYAIRTNPSLQAEVLRKCNKALTKSGYTQLNDVTEVISTLENIFEDLANTDLAPPESERRELHFWAANRMLNESSLMRTRFTAERVGKLMDSVELILNRNFPQLSAVRLTRDGLIKVEILKHLNYELVIRSPRLAVVEHRGRDLITDIFNALWKSKGALLPEDWKERYDSVGTGRPNRARLICDYVACMTDAYAAEVHDRLFARGASMFKPL